MHILLVHGAMADGSSWSKITPKLQSAGHTVTTVQQPLTSLEDDIRTVKTAIETLNKASAGPLVVVGHSFGGVVITNAAHNAMNVAALVYVQAFAPDECETVAKLEEEYPVLPSNQIFVTDASGRLSLTQPDFVKYFAPDLPREEAAVLATSQGPCDGARFSFVSGPAAWREGKKLFYIVGDGDQIITPELQTFLAKRMGAKTTHLVGASHAGILSQAGKVADVILEAASSSA